MVFLYRPFLECKSKLENNLEGLKRRYEYIDPAIEVSSVKK